MKWFAVVLGLVLGSCAGQLSNELVVDGALRSVAYIEFADGVCTGVLIGQGQVLTAKHCVEAEAGIVAEPWLRMQGQSAEDLAKGLVLWRSERLDIALISAPVAGPTMGIDCGPSRHGEQGWIIGHPLGVGWKVTRGGVLSAEAPRDGLQAIYGAIYPGNSGGPFVSADGQLRGVLSSVISSQGGLMGLPIFLPYGFMVPAEDICRELANRGAT